MPMCLLLTTNIKALLNTVSTISAKYTMPLNKPSTFPTHEQGSQIRGPYLSDFPEDCSAQTAALPDAFEGVVRNVLLFWYV